MIKRIEYIDALRGFTMFCVVTGHIYYFSFMHDKFNNFALSYNNFFELFLMPLFFFISGFFFYRPNTYWDYKSLSTLIAKKIRTLLFSAFAFCGLFCFTYQQDLSASLFDVHKSGYWFTYVLFIFFLTYIAIDIIICLIYKKTAFNNYTCVLSTIIGLLLYYYINNGYLLSILSPSTTSLLSINKWQYFLFFQFGCIIHKYYKSFITFQKCRYSKDLILVSFTGSSFCIFYQNNTSAFIIHNYILKLFAAIFGILFLMILFRSNRTVFSNNNIICRSLQYIGKRTLDVYYLHFFFIPYNLAFIGMWFESNPNPILEFFASMTLASLVIACSLLVGNAIRLCPLLSYLLLGVKRL